MKIFWVVLLVHVMKSECKSFGDEIGKTVYQELSPEPFDVPPVNESISRGSRIVYGTSAAAKQFPHFALIFVRRPTATAQCGAGLIKLDWALTANHCVKEALSIELRFGVTHRNTFEQRVYASALARYLEVDMALIKLASSVRLTEAVIPALLPRKSQADNDFVGREATVCGMGIENQKTNEISSYLKYTALTIMSQTDCKKIYGIYATPTVLCAIHKTSLASTCPGDSGSPLVLYEDNKPVIVGIVSFGAGAGCDQGYPVGYVRVTKQLSWIIYYTELVLRT